MTIERLDGAAVLAAADELAMLIADAVAGGASVGLRRAPDLRRRPCLGRRRRGGRRGRPVYRRLGWNLVGTVPEYAASPEDGLRSTSFYYRLI